MNVAAPYHVSGLKIAKKQKDRKKAPSLSLAWSKSSIKSLL